MDHTGRNSNANRTLLKIKITTVPSSAENTRTTCRATRYAWFARLKSACNLCAMSRVERVARAVPLRAVRAAPCVPRAACCTFGESFSRQRPASDDSPESAEGRVNVCLSSRWQRGGGRSGHSARGPLKRLQLGGPALSRGAPSKRLSSSQSRPLQTALSRGGREKARSPF